jgi:hypothetical protein
MKAIRFALLAAACALPLAASAQWQWIDKTGRKVFSDQAPPPDIPAKSILKAPGGRMPVQPAEADAAANATGTGTTVAAAAPAKPAASGASAPKTSGKDKELEDKKKQAEAADAEKKKADQEKVAKARADNCDRAKKAKATFDSGVRVQRTNDKGEKEYVDDAYRAAESKRLQGIIDTDCKAS